MSDPKRVSWFEISSYPDAVALRGAEVSYLVEFSIDDAGCAALSLTMGGERGQAIQAALGEALSLAFDSSTFDRIRNAFDEFRTRQR